MARFKLNPNRFFDSDPKIRRIAAELYSQVKNLPIISPHGHVDARLLADNSPFPDPAELILIPDHYIFRMLYSQGIALETLGIPTIDGLPAGRAVEKDHRKIWQTFADHFYLFAGTPTGAWLIHELSEVFGVTEKLNGASALRIYDHLQDKLHSAEFLPRALFDRFRIEVLTTTDGAADTLSYHQKIKDSGWPGRVLPAFRPDAVINIAAAGWRAEIGKLEKVIGRNISSFKEFITALEERRSFFKTMGATSTDQGVFSPYTHKLSQAEIESIFKRGLQAKVDEKDAPAFTGHMLMEMARMSVEDGLVMQIHPGSFRNHNRFILQRFGTDKGSDIPVQTEYTHNLYELLNEYGNDPRLTLVVFTLDESTYSRELAPLAGHYPAMKLGPSWWFHDSIEGMTRFRECVTETAGIYNTVGFIDDTRAFLSIPARHDLSRRVDANFLARLVTRHIIDQEDAQRMIHDLTYNLAKKTFKL
jgi:glucuronate isomerase